jgi:hypothetical protein
MHSGGIKRFVRLVDCVDCVQGALEPRKGEIIRLKRKHQEICNLLLILACWKLPQLAQRFAKKNIGI